MSAHGKKKEVMGAKARSDAARLRISGKSVAVQSAKDSTDINKIVARFRRTGLVPVSRRLPMNGDFTNAPDFRGAMDQIRGAIEGFDALPAKIRQHFHNDPAEFVDACSDEERRDELKKLGIIVDKPGPEPEVIHKVKVVPDDPPNGGK